MIILITKNYHDTLTLIDATINEINHNAPMISSGKAVDEDDPIVNLLADVFCTEYAANWIDSHHRTDFNITYALNQVLKSETLISTKELYQTIVDQSVSYHFNKNILIKFQDKVYDFDLHEMLDYFFTQADVTDRVTKNITLYSADELPTLINRYTLHDARDRRISNDDLVDALQQMWRLQFNPNDCQQEKAQLKDELSEHKALKALIKLVQKYIRYENSASIVLTAYQLALFCTEVRKHHLTSETSSVQAWLLDSTEENENQNKTNDFYQHLKNDQNFNRLTKMEIVDFKEIKSFVDQFEQSDINKNKFHVDLAIKLNHPAQTKEYPHHQTVIHGTEMQNAISIALNGLMTNDELNNSNIDHTFSGDALGSGIYFTDPKKPERSLRFGHNGKYTCIFIADIGYHDTFKTTKFNIRGINKNQDRIVATNVGMNIFTDEIVARNSDQVQLKYLIIMH